MNLIDIVKNAPEGATHYGINDKDKVVYYKNIKHGVSYEYRFIGSGWTYIDRHPSIEFHLFPKLETSYEVDKRQIWDTEDDFNAGELYHKLSHSREFVKIENIETLAQAVNQGSCYRRVDKIIDEREEFKRKMDKLVKECNSKSDESLFDFFYSKGCRFIGGE